MNPLARAVRPDPELYLPISGRDRAQSSAEQDAAAGARQARRVVREDGVTVLGSVALRCYPASRRVYAYLRWSSGSRRTVERYLGDVSHCPDRATALAEAWSRVADQARLTDSTPSPSMDTPTAP